MSRIALLALALLTSGSLICPPAADAAARTGYFGWGPRLGLTMEPDQVHFGVHLDLGYVASQVRIQPIMEYGIGDHVSLFAIAVDTHYRFVSDVKGEWTPYAGGGLAIHRVEVDQEPLLNDVSDTEVGMNVVLGADREISNANRFLAEARLGLADAPDFKLTVGWTFH